MAENSVFTSFVEFRTGGVRYPFAIEPASYVKRDLIDFAPRAGGGDVAYSNLDLYQIVTQDSWHHGIGFVQFRDKFGHRITSDDVDARHIGMAMMHTAYVNEYTFPYLQEDFGNVKSVVDFDGVTYFNCGTNGIWKRTTAGSFSKVLSANVHSLISNGSYLIASIVSAQMKTSVNGTTWTDAGVSGNPPTNFQYLAIHNGFMWGVEKSAATRTLTGVDVAGELAFAGDVDIITGNGTKFLTELSENDVIKIGATYTAVVHHIYSDIQVAVSVSVAGARPGGTSIIKFASTGYIAAHFWASSDSSDAEGGGIADVAAITVGGGDFDARGLVSFNGALYAAREDGLWAIDDTVVPPVARRVLDFADEQHPSNFTILTPWRGRLYFNVKNMLYAYNGASLSDVTPPTYSLDFPPSGFGGFVGSTYRGPYIYVIARNNDATPKYYLLAFDGTGWFSLKDFGPQAPTGLGYSPLVNAIFVGTSSMMGDILIVKLQSDTELPYAYFSTVGYHYLNMSEIDFGFRRVKKSFAEIDIEVYNVAAGRYVAVDYAADGGSWYRLGYTTQSGVTELVMSPTVEANKLDVRFDFQTADSAQSPILRNFAIKAMVRPNVLYGHQFMVKGADFIQMLDGTQHSLSSEEQKIVLETLRDTAAPFEFVDPFGISHQVYISTCTFRNIVRRPGEKRSNWDCILNCVEVR